MRILITILTASLFSCNNKVNDSSFIIKIVTTPCEYSFKLNNETLSIQSINYAGNENYIVTYDTLISTENFQKIESLKKQILIIPADTVNVYATCTPFVYEYYINDILKGRTLNNSAIISIIYQILTILRPYINSEVPCDSFFQLFDARMEEK